MGGILNHTIPYSHSVIFVVLFITEFFRRLFDNV